LDVPNDPKFSICQLTMPDTTFEDDLRIVAATGATGIALAEEKLRAGDEAEQLAAFRASGLTATVCLPTNIGALPIQPAIIYAAPQDPAVRVGLMCDSVRRLAPFAPDSIVVTTGSEVGRTREEATSIAVETLREVARVAEEEGTRLSLEPCRRDLGFDASFVQGLADTVALLDLIDRPNVGVCFDVYHHWDEPDLIDRIGEHADRIVGIQVNDWREPPRSFADRLVPGDGSIDLPAIFAALARGGYDGWYDFELFSDDGRWGTDLPDSLWKIPPRELAERGLAGMVSAWDQATRSAV
jgi:sugar phosphate isomerase/epimerase